LANSFEELEINLPKIFREAAILAADARKTIIGAGEKMKRLAG
jgi:hypothetical protein